LPFHREIALNDCTVIALGNTASGSTSGIAYAFDGRREVPTKLKSRTITKNRNESGKQSQAAEFVARRLPRERPPTHPGEMLLEEFVKPLGITQTELALRLGVSFPRLNEIIRGKRAMTPDTALRLARVIGMSADFWLGLQSDWDLWHAMRSADATEISQLVPLRTIA
jgi:addiction module HigA family antidote